MERPPPPTRMGDDDAGGSSERGAEDRATTEADMMLSLSRRLLELEIAEAGMEVAACEQRAAVARTRRRRSDEEAASGAGESERAATARWQEARERLRTAETALRELASATESTAAEDVSSPVTGMFARLNGKSGDADAAKNAQRRGGSELRSLLMAILDKMAEQDQPPPYRGAIGYPAKLDSMEETFEDAVLPYRSPYELLLEIIAEQLHSEVAACVLEPASCLEGNVVLGGALLLKRKGVKKSTKLAGEEVSYTDDEDALGNEGVLPGSMYLVECFSDEALGMAMAAEQPLLVEEGICRSAGTIPVELDVDAANRIKTENSGGQNCVTDMDSLSFLNRVPPLRPVDGSEFSFQREGDQISSEGESKMVRIPLTTSPDLFSLDRTPPSSAQSSVFSTFNPVNTLDEYDELTDDAKTRLLLKLESFTGILPRPRVVRTSIAAADGKYGSGTPPSLLDDLLLPLIDEAVRRQYLVRDAVRRRDFEAAEALKGGTSERQAALESARRAREEGRDDEAERLEEEAQLYKALRADATQDEGAYSRFLDRDEWYEREAQERIKRLDRSKFGTLLD